MKNILDIVIPAHQKDLDTLKYCIKHARRNIKDVRRVIVVSKEKYSDEAEWFDESLFPFSIKDVVKITGSECRAGWYLQQLLKLYAVMVIPDISENILILDSDTVFMRKVTMFDEVNNLPLYNLSKDNITNDAFYKKTINHITKLLPNLKSKNIPANYRNISGISHHALFQKKVIENLFLQVEKNDPDKDPFYKIFLKHCSSSHEASEYNLYYRFILYNYFDQVKFRKLEYKNTADFNIAKYQLRRKYHYCSFHSYMRVNKNVGSYLKLILNSLSYKLF